MSKETVYWTTKTGKQIDIDDMDIDHLRNCLKMIVRNKNTEYSYPYDWGDFHDIH